MGEIGRGQTFCPTRPNTERGAFGFGLVTQIQAKNVFIECVEGGVLLLKQWEACLKV